MRKLLLKVSSGPGYSFSVTREEVKHFYGEYHYHPEFELTLIVRGQGTRFVGDNIESFSSGDLVLLGSDLPHVWKSDTSNQLQNSQGPYSCSIAVHFSKEFLSDQFLSLPELHAIDNLLKRSSRGIVVRGKTKQEVTKLLVKMVDQSSMERLITLLTVLHHLSMSRDSKLLTTSNFANIYLPDDSTRIKNVYQYVVTHFKEEIRLAKAAQTANMSATSFSRYFKQRTQKTFASFVNEIRVSYACRLLQDENKKIAEVCYESGFSNLSNFNKQFKTVMHLTPIQYIKTGIGKKF